MATEMCKRCLGSGWVEDQPYCKTPCQTCGSEPTRRDDLTPEAILKLQATAPENQTNPKDLVAKRKVSLSKLPLVALAHGAHAMMDGARKYGPYNWRDKEVFASVYVDAALRHIICWFEGEERAEDSDVHHLGHALACIAILLDAQACGKLRDDRPHPRAPISNVFQDLMERIQKMPPATVVTNPHAEGGSK